MKKTYIAPVLGQEYIIKERTISTSGGDITYGGTTGGNGITSVDAKKNKFGSEFEIEEFEYLGLD